MKISEVTGDRIDNKAKLEIIKQEEAAIRLEKEEREKAVAKEKQEEELKKKVEEETVLNNLYSIMVVKVIIKHITKITCKQYMYIDISHCYSIFTLLSHCYLTL